MFQPHPGAWSAFYSCKEYPHWNLLTTFCDGEEKEISTPLCGSKIKVNWKFTKDGFCATTVDCPYGAIEMTYQFTVNGITVTVNAKKLGATVVEKWTR